jgi:hypothetical protein
MDYNIYVDLKTRVDQSCGGVTFDILLFMGTRVNIYSYFLRILNNSIYNKFLFKITRLCGEEVNVNKDNKVWTFYCPVYLSHRLGTSAGIYT